MGSSADVRSERKGPWLQANFLLMEREADAAMRGEYIGPFLLLTDFGMAQSIQGENTLKTPKGTPLFM